MDEQKRTRKNLWMFPLGTVGRDMIYTLFTNFILTYILFTRSLTAAQLSMLLEGIDWRRPERTAAPLLAG